MNHKDIDDLKRKLHSERGIDSPRKRTMNRTWMIAGIGLIVFAFFAWKLMPTGYETAIASPALPAQSNLADALQGLQQLQEVPQTGSIQQAPQMANMPTPIPTAMPVNESSPDSFSWHTRADGRMAVEIGGKWYCTPRPGMNNIELFWFGKALQTDPGHQAVHGC